MAKDTKPDAELAQVNAELAAEHAARAADEAAAAERDLAEATKDDESARLCPHDNAEMVQHVSSDAAKNGAWHCNGCGCCFRGRKVRDGHPSCPKA